MLFNLEREDSQVIEPLVTSNFSTAYKYGIVGHVSQIEGTSISKNVFPPLPTQIRTFGESEIVVTKPKCNFCTKKHPEGACRFMFNKIRSHLVKNNICFNCLNKFPKNTISSHSSICKKMCQMCSKPHSALFCTENLAYIISNYYTLLKL